MWVSILAPEIFHLKDNFSTGKKEMVDIILDGSWTGYYRRWKMYQDENCVEVNTCHKRKMSRMKTYFKSKKRLDKG